MARKIEQLLRTMGDLHRFSENNNTVSKQANDELMEEELDLIAAASYEPIDWETFKAKHSDIIH
jgi:hypothetical protein